MTETLEMSEELRATYHRLWTVIESMQSMMIAYSGGVDSALLAYVAHRAIGERALPVLAISESMPAREADDARGFLDRHGIHYETIRTREMGVESYVRNAPDRCYFCKAELFTRIDELPARGEYRYVAYGANLDDRGDYRPGALAATERQVVAPLVEAGLCKAKVRDLARALGLSVWDKPAAPCLASRIPYHQPVTPEKLRQVEAAENLLKDLGFRVCRVRHHGATARIEIPVADHDRLRAPETWRQVEEGIRSAGFADVVVEPDGFRSGRLNEAVTPLTRRPGSGKG